MKFISWNVNGIRACAGKGFMDFFQETDADIFCIQETKMQEGQLELDTPGVDTCLLRIKIPECIYKSGIQKLCEFLTLFIGKSGIFPIRLWILQINLCMRYIQITAENNRLCLFQLFQVCKKIFLPFHTIIQSCKLALGVWCIHGNKVKIFKLQCDHTPFLVVLLDSKSVAYADWFLLGKYCCPRITFFLRIIPVLMISRWNWI